MSDLAPAPQVDVVGPMEGRLRQWIAMGSRIDPSACISGNENHPAPEVSPYIVITFISERPAGQAETLFSGEPGEVLNAELRQSVIATYDVQWIREGARAAARLWRTWSMSRIGQAAAENMGVAIANVTPIRQIDKVYLGSFEWEERVGVDVTLRYLHTDRAMIPAIASADVRINLDADGRAYTETVEGAR